MSSSRQITATQGLKPSQKVELKYNKGTWHVFTHRRKQTCLCGSTHRHRNYRKNHCRKTRTIQNILENPDQGLGHLNTKAHRKLQRKVNQP